jgi:2-oxo-4-hydroxy-4-carboxy-5-ureidoimidazoline decarboxylase
MDIDAANRMDRQAFAAAFGGVFEHSPWVAERAHAARPFADLDALHAAMVRAVEAATGDEKVALLRAHPDLAGKEAQEGTMTDSSVSEQASAGLDRLTRAEMAEIARLNAAYRAAHGFPFIIAVRHHTKDTILREFRRRVSNDTERELAANLAQIAAITRMRLARMFGEAPEKESGTMAADPPPDPASRAGSLTFHAIDTFHGGTAAPLAVELAFHDGGAYRRIGSFRTLPNGRSDGTWLEGTTFRAGRYELLVDVGDYFAGLGDRLPNPPFISRVPVRFGVAEPRERYHIAFLFGPWSYAYYRGS